MIFWCILAFVLAGFEHYVANMSSLTMAILHPGPGTINFWDYFYVLFTSALGNMIGSTGFVALPYWLISPGKKDHKQACKTRGFTPRMPIQGLV